jgi:phage-related minor tail protein
VRLTLANDLVVDIGADSSGLDRGLADIKTNLAIVADSLGEMGNKINSAFADAIGTVAEVNSGLLKFQNQTGVSTEEMKKYGKEIEELYKGGMGESLEDVSTAMANVKQQSKQLGIESSKDLSRITESALYLRDNFEVDLPESTKTAGNLIKNFGLTADEAFDFISKGFQDGLNQSDDLMDTLYEYSPQFAKIGLDANDMFSILKKGSEGGVFTLDKVGDAVKEFGIRAMDASKTSQQAFTDIGLDADKMTATFAKGGEEANKAFYTVIDSLAKMKDPVKQNTAGVALFGTMWEDLGPQVITSFADIDKSAVKFDGTMQQIKDNTADQDIGNKFKQIGRTIQLDVVKPLAQSLLPTIETVVEYAKVALPQIGEVVKNIHPAIVIAVAAFGLLTGVVIKILSIVGMMMPAIEALGVAIGAMTAPMWIAIGAVIALIAVFILFKDQIISAFQTAWNTVSPIISKIWSFIKEKWDQYVAPVINEQLPKLKAAFFEAFTNIQTNLQTVIPVISSIITSLKPVFEIIIAVLKTVVQIVIVVFGQIIAFLGDTIKNIVTLFNGLVTTLTGIFNVFAGIFTGDWKRVWEGIKQIVSGVGTTIKSIIQQALNFILTVVTSVLNSISSIFGVKFGNVRKIVMDAWNNMVNSFVDGKNRAINIVSELGNTIISTISNLGSRLYNAGKNLISQLVKGISDGIGKVKNACKKATDAIASFFPHSPAKEGALKDFPKVGGTLMSQLVDGIEDNELKVRASVSGVADKISGAIAPTNTSNMNSSNITIPIYLDGRKMTEVVAPLMTKAIRMQGGI